MNQRGEVLKTARRLSRSFTELRSIRYSRDSRTTELEDYGLWCITIFMENEYCKYSFTTHSLLETSRYRFIEFLNLYKGDRADNGRKGMR